MARLVFVAVFLAAAVCSCGGGDAAGWSGETMVDDFSGETNYASMSRGGGDVSMWVMCIENTTLVSFQMENGIARDGSFQYRLDDSDVRNAEWNADNDDITAVGIRAIAFIMEIINGRELRVRFYNSPIIDATFNLEGMAEHVSEVKRLCGW